MILMKNFIYYEVYKVIKYHFLDALSVLLWSVFLYYTL